jgi:hypothetical protein
LIRSGAVFLPGGDDSLRREERIHVSCARGAPAEEKNLWRALKDSYREEEEEENSRTKKRVDR